MYKCGNPKLYFIIINDKTEILNINWGNETIT